LIGLYLMIRKDAKTITLAMKTTPNQRATL